MQNCPKLFKRLFGKNGSCLIVDSKATIQSKYLIFEPIKLTITGFKMMPKSNPCASSIMSYSRLKMMKTMRALKNAVNPILFYKYCIFWNFITVYMKFAQHIIPYLIMTCTEFQTNQIISSTTNWRSNCGKLYWPNRHVMYVFGICTTFGITWIVQKLFGSYIWYCAGKIAQD